MISRMKWAAGRKLRANTDRGTDIGSCDCTGNDDVSECISGVRQDAAAGRRADGGLL